MLLGFDNDFVLEKIFGDNDVFENAIVDNIKYSPLGFRMSMDILTECKVFNPPKRWDTLNVFNIVRLKLDFFGVGELKIKIVNKPLKLNSFVISEYEYIDKYAIIYIINILASNGSNISCKFNGGRIQNVIPIKDY